MRQTKHIRFLFAIALLVVIATFSNPFGFPTLSSGPRILQFAAKIVF